MNERLKELAAEARIQESVYNPVAYSKTVWAYLADFERFVELVRQDEREACAAVVEGRLSEGLNFEGCAATIRARGDRTKTSRDICGND